MAAHDRRPETTGSADTEKEAVVIKKYANRRLYNTETSTYVTLDDLATMVRSDRDFVVFDAKTGDDLTHSVLTQIIVEQEAKSGGQTLLPVPFLRQLIRFYDDSIGKMVPSYLQMSLQTLVNEQERFRSQIHDRSSRKRRRQERVRGDAGADPQEHGHVRAGDEDVDAVLRCVADGRRTAWRQPARPGQQAQGRVGAARRSRRADRDCSGIERSDPAELKRRARRHAR